MLHPTAACCVPSGLLTLAPPASLPGLTMLHPSCGYFVDVETALMYRLQHSDQAAKVTLQCPSKTNNKKLGGPVSVLDVFLCLYVGLISLAL